MLLQWQPVHTYSRFPLSAQNFGDHLPSLFETFFAPDEWQRLIQDPVNGYCFLGSTLCDGTFRDVLSRGIKPHYLCCGYRGEVLAPDLLAQVYIYGCRGLFSQLALQEAGKKIDVVGDPAMLIPMLIPKPESGSSRLLVPHVFDRQLENFKAADYGCDRLIIPLTYDLNDLTQMIGDIASADFVLAGAMHAAIIAHAYRVPFAFFDDGYRDCPKKWEDWGSSVGLQPSQIMFFHNVGHGREWYENVKSDLRHVPTLPILCQIAQIAHIGRKWLEKAWQLDIDPHHFT